MSKRKKIIFLFSLDFTFTKTPSKTRLSGNRRAACLEQTNTKYVTRKTAYDVQ